MRTRSNALKPGQIFLADAGGEARRPVVIVSREELNRGSYVIAVPFTSAKYEERAEQPNCVAFEAGKFGLTKNCVAQAEAITVIEIITLDLDTGPIGRLNNGAMRELIRAIGYVIGSQCEPD
jgi:mRNA-degrading endonuclease toxin of MazEF toxin-antitoxin module